jgi:hypothetical protein
VDTKGNVHYTQEIETIPKEYHSKVKKFDFRSADLRESTKHASDELSKRGGNKWTEDREFPYDLLAFTSLFMKMIELQQKDDELTKPRNPLQ